MNGFRLVFALVLSACLCMGQRASAPLTEQQIIALIETRAADAVVAASIEDRRLSFEPTREWLLRLEQRGAGSKTVAALSRFVVVTELTIAVTPAEADCEVFVDNAPAQLTDVQGMVTIRDLPAGTHRVLVRKPPLFQDAEQRVDIRRGSQRVSVRLSPKSGRLSITPDSVGAIIVIEGVGWFTGAVRDVECPPGTYSVTVTAPQHRAFTQTVTLGPGQRLELAPKMALDPLASKELLAEVEQFIRTKNYRAAIDKSRAILASEPDDVRALSLLAEAHYGANEYEKASLYAEQALEKGGAVRVPAYHHHNMATSHPMTVLITRSGIEFTSIALPTIERCPLRGVSVPATSISDLSVIQNNQGGILLHMRIPDPGNSKKQMTVNLGDRDAHVVEGPRTLNSNHKLMPGPHAQAALKAIGDLLITLQKQK